MEDSRNAYKADKTLRGIVKFKGIQPAPPSGELLVLFGVSFNRDSGLHYTKETI